MPSTLRLSFLGRPNIGTSYSRVMQWLIDGRLDPNLVLDWDGAAVVHYAATNRLNILRAVIDRGGKCKLKDAHGATPLHFAAAQGPLGPGPEAIRLLMKCGADPNLRDRRGVTPLHAVYRSVTTVAVIYGLNSINAGRRQDVLQTLLAAGADPNIKDNGDNTPLMLLIKDRRDGAVVFTAMGHLRLLLKHGADPNTRDKGGTTPLIVVIGSGSNSTNWNEDRTVPIITALLKGGADPNLRDSRGDTPLIHAAKHEDDIVSETKALLAGGADPCLADGNGKLPIDHAGEDSPIGRLLYKAGGYRDKATGACVGAALAAEKKLGLSRKKVVQIQRCLKRQGFDPGTPDGMLGSRSRTAIHGWQKGEARKATGYLTQGDVDGLLAACAVAVSPVCSGETGKGCWMEVNNRSGCYKWNPNPQPNETVSWSGSCVDGKASGRGKVVWRYLKDGAWKTSSDEGELREGKIKLGHWTHGFSDGVVVEGPFADGKRHGLWVRHGSGDIFCFRDGERVDKTECVKSADRKMQAKQRAELRLGPGSSYSEIGVLEAREEVQVTGEVGDWFWVEAVNERKGFVRVIALQEWEKPKIVIEPKPLCKRGGREECWLKLSDRDCYFYVGLMMTDFATSNLDDTRFAWSGACSGRGINGAGTLTSSFKSRKHGVVSKSIMKGTFSGGKADGHCVIHYDHASLWTDRSSGSLERQESWGTRKGDYVNGQPDGLWRTTRGQVATNSYQGVDRNCRDFIYDNGKVVSSKVPAYQTNCPETRRLQ